MYISTPQGFAAVPQDLSITLHDSGMFQRCQREATAENAVDEQGARHPFPRCILADHSPTGMLKWKKKMIMQINDGSLRQAPLDGFAIAAADSARNSAVPLLLTVPE